MKSVPPTVTIVLTIALLGIGTLYVARIVDLFPLQHDVSSENSSGDDWFAYHRYALSILNDLATCMLVSSLMPLRNYAVTGEPSLAAVTGASDWWVAGHIGRADLTVPQRAARIVRSIAMRAAYVVGIPYFLQPTFRIRPHWLILWACFF